MGDSRSTPVSHFGHLSFPTQEYKLRIFTKKRKEHQRVGGERVRPPNCVIAFVRAAESSTGWDSAVPIQLQWWPSCSKGDGVTDLWLKKDLLVVTTIAATQHHAPGMFVPRVYISPTSSPPRSLDMPGPGISNRSRSRCISCSDSNASLEDSSLVSSQFKILMISFSSSSLLCFRYHHLLSSVRISISDDTAE